MHIMFAALCEKVRSLGSRSASAGDPRVGRLWLVLIGCGLSLCGCGPRPVTGGTPGTLHARSLMLADLQLVVYRVEGGTPAPIGLAQTGTDGSFALVSNGAQGPLRLSPGEYRITVETAGSPARIPPAYARPESTPLQINWTAADRVLDLEANDITLP